MILRTNHEVRDHLSNTTGEARKATLCVTGGQRIRGQLMPSGDANRLVFQGASSGEVRTLVRGDAVRLIYRQEPGNCEFDSEVIAIGAESSVILRLPQAIEVEETRRAERLEMKPQDQVGLTILHENRPFPVGVVNVSLTGIGFFHDPDRLPLKMGQTHQARVSRGRKAVDITFEVRHIQANRNDQGQSQVGARYEGLTMLELDQLLKLVRGA